MEFCKDVFFFPCFFFFCRLLLFKSAGQLPCCFKIVFPTILAEAILLLLIHLFSPCLGTIDCVSLTPIIVQTLRMAIKTGDGI